MTLKAVPTHSSDIHDVLHRVSHWLPTQGPIKDFIHHNTLHAFLDLPFHEGLARASGIYGARPYLDISWYQDAFRRGAITPEALKRVIEKEGPPSEQENLRVQMLSPQAPLPRPQGIRDEGVRSRWLHERGVDIDYLCQPIAIRMLATFLDQGVAIWRMPGADKKFWHCLRELVQGSWLPIPPLSDSWCKERLQEEPHQVIERCLAHLVSDPSQREEYLLGTLLASPGWSGIVGQIEREPGSLLAHRSITLAEYAAFLLVLDVGWLRRKLGKNFEPLAGPTPERTPVNHATLRIARLWQEALETSYALDLLGALELNAKTSSRAERPAFVQAFFCIDDREESLRRHLEETLERVETFATAGFFGIDFLFQGLQSAYPAQQCPVVVRPKHLVREQPGDPERYKVPRLTQLLHLTPASNTLFRGWIVSQTLGLGAAIRLFINVFRPTLAPPTEKALSKVEAHTKLHLFRQSDTPTPEGFLLGYSIDEMADRVAGVLRQVGLTRGLSNLIVFIAHGSSSVNNPHFAAYDCGACSGKPGAPNSRAFAIMANHPEVRAKLVERGIVMPATCRVLGALHDTARDEVSYFDLGDLPSSHRALFEEFDKGMRTALKKNAKERTRRFDNFDPMGGETEALHHVRNRASAIFEPRPELNHATNACAIVGRRHLTRSLFLDRRAFLNSYDPTQDPDGTILAGILGAVVPVCGGISLEYLFSRIDNEVYGAGTKLPHNVVGLIGVSNGVESDLRTGLPSQMIELHDPLRLLLVVEQTPEVALKAARKSPAIFEWVHNDWVRFAAIHPTDGLVYLYEKGEMIRPALSARALPSGRGSLAICQGKSGNIPVHQIERNTP